MAGDRAAQIRAHANGARGERDALREGLRARVQTSLIIDAPDDKTEVKTAELIVAQPGGKVRTGRFRFDREQYEHLVRIGGSYQFRVIVGDETIHLCTRPATDLPISADGTIPWNRVCFIDPARLKP